MKQKYFIFIFSAIIILSLSFIFLLSRIVPKSPTAEIYVDKTLFRRIPMNDIDAPLSIDISQNGSSNTVVVTNKSVYMKSADCPDKLCVNQGAVSTGLLPLVCLPNHVTVRIIDDSNQSAADAVSR